VPWIRCARPHTRLHTAFTSTLSAVPDLTPHTALHANHDVHTALHANHDVHSPPARARHTSMVLESVVAGDALGRTVVEVVRASDYH
jgi:hypothetical protein